MGTITDLKCIYGKRSPTTMVSVILGCGIMYALTITCESATYIILCIYFFFFGMFLQSVNNTIASTCSADIGRGSGKSKSLTSTVTGIIDGSGSIGSAIAMFTIGAASTAYGWQLGYLLPISIICTLAIIPIGIILSKELK